MFHSNHDCYCNEDNNRELHCGLSEKPVIMLLIMKSVQKYEWFHNIVYRILKFVSVNYKKKGCPVLMSVPDWVDGFYF